MTTNLPLVYATINNVTVQFNRKIRQTANGRRQTVKAKGRRQRAENR
jgi:hypothetical protein